MEPTDADLDRLKAIALGDYVAPPKDAFDLHTADLFGGIAGFPLPVQHFELLPGLTLTRTYAHLIAPFIMAFSPPERPRSPHPGPWAALREGGLTILVEIKLDAGVSPLGFDRLNTLWFVVALLRLRLALPLQMPVLADRGLQEIAANVEAANLLPVELNLSQLLTAPPRIPTEADLEWVRENIVGASELMKEPLRPEGLFVGLPGRHQRPEPGEEAGGGAAGLGCLAKPSPRCPPRPGRDEPRPQLHHAAAVPGCMGRPSRRCA